MPQIIKLNKAVIKAICKKGLNEDLNPKGDITTNLINKKKIIKAKLISNQAGIVGGLLFARETFKLIDKNIKFYVKKKEGSHIKKNDLIVVIVGKAHGILKAERLALNLMSHISGIATKTNKFVKKINKKCKICCTRKTLPGLRLVQKYAVKLGGGYNHRFNLSDEYLIKDNHLSTLNIKEIVNKAIKNKKGKKITVEVDSLGQLNKIIGLKFDTVLFDNMNLKYLRRGVKLAKKYYETEASGNINIKSIKSISKTGVDRISIGSLTHSVNALDFKLQF